MWMTVTENVRANDVTAYSDDTHALHTPVPSRVTTLNSENKLEPTVSFGVTGNFNNRASTGSINSAFEPVVQSNAAVDAPAQNALKAEIAVANEDTFAGVGGFSSVSTAPAPERFSFSASFKRGLGLFSGKPINTSFESSASQSFSSQENNIITNSNSSTTLKCATPNSRGILSRRAKPQSVVPISSTVDVATTAVPIEPGVGVQSETNVQLKPKDGGASGGGVRNTVIGAALTAGLRVVTESLTSGLSSKNVNTIKSKVHVDASEVVLHS